MPVAPSTTKYTLLMRLLHWLIAILILAMIGLGWYMKGLPQEDPGKYELYDLHKSIGVTILALVIIRLLARFVSPIPELPPALSWWEKLLTKVIHFVIYLLMLAIPVSGFLMSEFAGFAVKWFGYEIPGFIPDNMELSELAEEVHEVLPYVLLALIVLHILGTLKHRFLDKDKDADVLKRMI